MRKRLLIALLVIAGMLSAAAMVPRAQSSTPFNVVVICVKCVPEDMPQEAYNAGNILLDQNTGNLWFYPALSRGVKPRLLGRFPAMGEPLLPPDQAPARR
ncbi:MAG TPA: hypothetical protein VK886_22765 [Vicinamibacterales bacterium]|nr:hypothetical protein [Vicinamibacterales bacterium]